MHTAHYTNGNLISLDALNSLNRHSSCSDGGGFKEAYSLDSLSSLYRPYYCHNYGFKGYLLQEKKKMREGDY